MFEYCPVPLGGFVQVRDESVLGRSTEEDSIALDFLTGKQHGIEFFVTPVICKTPLDDFKVRVELQNRLGIALP